MRNILYKSVLVLINVFILLPFFVTSIDAVKISKQDLQKAVLQDVKAGRKVKMSRTFVKNRKNLIDNTFVIFVKKGSVSKVVSGLQSAKYTVQKTYGEVTAIPLVFNEDVNINKALNELDSNSEVIAISQAVKRFPFAVSAPNDPQFPNGNFSGTYQWYLNQTSGSNYGIDILNAWNHIDSLGKTWGGDSSLVVAVIDSGLAYENYTKYGSYALMDSPTGWEFDKGTEVTDNIYINDDETADNSTDDDANGELDDYLLSSPSVPYCLDANANGQCDSPSERTKGMFDDRNGISLIDYYWYHDPVYVSTSPFCSNSPYTGYRCVLQRYCQLADLPNTDYWGCEASDMGHPDDFYGHGTAVTNIIAGKVNNSAGGTGIAPGVQILPIQIFGMYYNSSSTKWESVGGSSVMVAQAIEYAVDAGAKIINMSFGGPDYDIYEELAMESAYYDEDILLVAASGNQGTEFGDVAMYPASFDSVLSVGASNKNGTKASYTIHKSGIEVSSPVDTGILSQSYTCYFTNNCLTDGTNTPNGTSQFTQFTSAAPTAGTSFAAPQVSAVAALLRSTYPTMTAQEARYVLNMSRTLNGASKYTAETGYGILNANNAVQLKDSANNSLNNQRILVMATTGTDSRLKLNYSLDGGVRWSGWASNIYSYDEVSVVTDVNTNKVFVFVRGSNNTLYLITGTVVNETVSWSGATNFGPISSAPKAINAGGTIIVTKRGRDGYLYTRRTGDYGVAWSGWKKGIPMNSDPGITYDAIHNRVVQVVRGSGNRVYSRYSNDKGATWSGWSYGGLFASSTVSVQSTGSKFMQATRATNGALYSRYSQDGITWKSWVKSSNITGDVAMTYTGTMAVQAARLTNGRTYIRYSTNKGRLWSGWFPIAISASSPRLFFDEGFKRMYITILKSDGYVYTRGSDNPSVSWNAWMKSGKSKTEINIGSSIYNTW